MIKDMQSDKAVNSTNMDNSHSSVSNISYQLDNRENIQTEKKAIVGHVKRPLNSFMVFSGEERKKIAVNNPNMAHSEISKMCSEKWRSMSEEEKKPFIDQALYLKEQHKEQFPDYVFRPCRKKNLNHNNTINSNIYDACRLYNSSSMNEILLRNNQIHNGYSSQKTEPNAWNPYNISQTENSHNLKHPIQNQNNFTNSPIKIQPDNCTNSPIKIQPDNYESKQISPENHVKRPLNSFIVFSSEQRKKIATENPNIAHSEISKMCSEKWRSMSEEEKKPFIDQALYLKEQHKEQFPDYIFRPRRKKTTYNVNLNSDFPTSNMPRQNLKVSDYDCHNIRTNDFEDDNLNTCDIQTIDLCEQSEVKEELISEASDDLDVQQEPHMSSLYARSLFNYQEEKRSDMGHVKRPLNSFMVFSGQQRKNIAAENHNMTHSEISKLCSEKWRSMSEEEKKPFIDQALYLKEQHKEQFPDYVFRPCRKRTITENEYLSAKILTQHAHQAEKSFLEKINNKNSTNNSNGKDEILKINCVNRETSDFPENMKNLPTCQINAFMVFACGEVKSNLNKFSKTDLKMICLNKWKNMSENEKSTYYETANCMNEIDFINNEDSSFLEVEIKEEPEEQERCESFEHSTIHLEEILPEKRSDAVHVKRPLNSFMVFSGEQRKKIAAKNPSMAQSEISKMCSERWRSMSEEEKKPFIDQALYLKNQHKEQFPGYVFRPCRKKVIVDNFYLNNYLANAQRPTLKRTVFESNNFHTNNCENNNLNNCDIQTIDLCEQSEVKEELISEASDDLDVQQEPHMSSLYARSLLNYQEEKR